jgi:cyanophycinase
VKAFAYLDATNIDVLYIDKREEAADEAVLTRLKAADIVIFTGGDQLRLTSILGGTASRYFIG